MFNGPVLNAKNLHLLFRYDEETGHLYWRESGQGRRLSSPAGTLEKSTGKIRVRCNGSNFYAHDLIWIMVSGRMWKSPVGHVNGNPADNRFDNLREMGSGPYFRDNLEVLNKHFAYSRETGELFWAEARQGRVLATPAGGLSRSTGGLVVHFNRASCKVEDIVWSLLKPDEPCRGVIRHRDGNKRNNRIDNLYDDYFNFL